MEDKDIAEDLQGTNAPDDSVPLESTEAVPEKMLSVSRVNELIKKAKRDKEKQMQEQLDEARQQIEQLQSQQGQQSPNQQQSNQQGMDAERIQRQVMEMMQQKMQEQEQQRHHEKLQEEVSQVAQTYFGKMAQGKEMFDDFESITADFDPAAFPQLVYLATQADNTPAIIYELQKNPAKLATLSHLVDKSPSMAKAEIAKLSQSIKANEDAKKNLQEAQDPLTRLKSSPAGADNGKMGLRDLKKASFLRV